MCGVLGIWNLDGQPVDPDALARARDTMTMRGPDDAGLWIDGPVGLAHRRLSILDLSPAGRMPMGNQDGSVQVAFNGEIYNFRELRAELEQLGHRFRSHTDSEVIVHGYAQWGLDCFARFDGMFAIGLWDGQARRMVLARDPHGKKPMYYHQDARRLLFASTLAPLAAWPGFPRRLDREALIEYASYGYVHAPRSFFANTAKVRPGHVVVIDARGARQERCYWSLIEAATRGAAGAVLGQDAAVERLEELFTAAVRKRLVADVPVGAFLSGGIDSSLVVAMLRHLGVSGVRTFTIGFDAGEFDETRHAQAVARATGVDNTVFRMRAADLLRFVPDIPRYFDEPMADFSLFPTLAVAQLAKQHVSVVLTGDGADELWGGYERLYATHLFDRFVRPVPAALRGRLAPLGRRLPHRRLAEFCRKSAAATTGEFFGEFLDLGRRFELDRLLAGGGAGEPPERRVADFVARLTRAPGLSATEAALLFEATHTMVDGILVKVDRGTMAFSLEARCPFLDKALSEFAVTRPLGQRLSVLGRKILLKRLLYRHLPRALFDRPKQGFSPPLREWFKHELREPLQDALSAATLRRRGLFDPDGVATMLRRHLAGEVNYTKPLWALFMLELWMQRYLDAAA